MECELSMLIPLHQLCSLISCRRWLRVCQLQTSANVTVTIIDNAILEEEELYNLALSIPPFPTFSIWCCHSDHHWWRSLECTVCWVQLLCVWRNRWSGPQPDSQWGLNSAVVVATMDGSATGEHYVSLWNFYLLRSFSCVLNKERPPASNHSLILKIWRILH